LLKLTLCPSQSVKSGSEKITTSLPEVVKFKLFIDEAEPVCPGKPEETVCELCDSLLADVDTATVLLDDAEDSSVAVSCDDDDDAP
jgi:hypothetical protein